MKTIQEIAQWVIDNRYPKSENNKVSDAEMYHTLIKAMNQVLHQPFVVGQSEQFYCADWNRCGSICIEQCDDCSNAENMPEPTFIETNPLIKACCIYCKQGYTEKHPTLFRVYAPGEYWQHWNFENIGCDENINNISPNGDAVKRQPPKP